MARKIRVPKIKIPKIDFESFKSEDLKLNSYWEDLYNPDIKKSKSTNT